MPNLVRPREVPGARNVGRNTLETLLFRGVSTPLALLLVVVQSRFLEPSGRGAFVLVVLSVTILSRLLGQLGGAVTNRSRAPSADLRALVSRALAVATVLGALGTAAVVSWGAATEGVGARLALIAAAGLIPNVVWQTISGVLLGVARVRLWNYVQLLSPALSFAGMLVVLWGFDLGLQAAVAAWAAAHLATAAFALAATRDLWLPFVPRLDREAWSIARLAIAMGAVQVVNLVTYRVELFVLDRSKGVAEVGIYSIAVQAAESLWLIAAAMATASTAPVVHEPTERGAARLIARTSGRAVLATAGAAAALGAVAPFVIPLALGEDFSRASRSLALLLPGAVAYAPVSIVTVYLSVRRGRPRLALAVSLVAMVVTLAAALVLIPRYGASGAAAGSSIGYAAGGLAAWLLFWRTRRAQA